MKKTKAYNIYYYKSQPYESGKTIILSVKTEIDAWAQCIAHNQDGGYEDENGCRFLVDYEEVNR